MENWTIFQTLRPYEINMTVHMLQPLEINKYEMCKVSSDDNVTVSLLAKYDSIISDENLNIFKNVFGLYLLLPVSVFGIIGNVISVSVLCHWKKKTASIYCLLALAISDLLLLLNAVLFSAIIIYINVDPFDGNNFRSNLFPYLGMYTSLVTARITSLITTLISIERFVAVHFPMRAKLICSKKSTFIAISIIYIFTIVAFIPFIFKYNVVHTNKDNTSYAIIARNPDISGKFCRTYGIIMNSIFRFLPVLLILLLNISIMLAVKRTARKRESLRSDKKPTHNQEQEQRKVTTMLLVVSFTFLICILPGAINSLLQTTWKGYSRLGRSKNFQQFLSYITFFLEVLNSAINFIIYMAMSAKFLNVFKEVFYSTKQCMKHAIFKRDAMSSDFHQRSTISISRKSSFSYTEEPLPQNMINLRQEYEASRSPINHSKDNVIVNQNGRNEVNEIYPLLTSTTYDSYVKGDSDKKTNIQKGLPPTDSSKTKNPRLVKQDTLETSLGES